MAKLTLHVPEDLVVAAKGEAASRDISLSKLVSDFFRSLTSEPQHSESTDIIQLAPKTQQLAGCLADADTSEYEEYLEKKHS